jgi:hypothetical protein
MRHAVYDPVLSVGRISHISLHRLRLDLQYSKSWLSHCPARRRGKSEGTVHRSPLLRVFKQDGEEVGSGSGACSSLDLRRMLVRNWVRPCDKSRTVGNPGQATPWLHGDPSFEFLDVSDAPFDIHFADLSARRFHHVHTEALGEICCKVA